MSFLQTVAMSNSTVLAPTTVVTVPSVQLGSFVAVAIRADRGPTIGTPFTTMLSAELVLKNR
jgi:hypothetical protein